MNSKHWTNNKMQVQSIWPQLIVCFLQQRSFIRIQTFTEQFPSLFFASPFIPIHNCFVKSPFFASQTFSKIIMTMLNIASGVRFSAHSFPFLLLSLSLCWFTLQVENCFPTFQFSLFAAKKKNKILFPLSGGLFYALALCFSLVTSRFRFRVLLARRCNWFPPGAEKRIDCERFFFRPRFSRHDSDDRESCATRPWRLRWQIWGWVQVGMRHRKSNHWLRIASSFC